MNSHTTNALHQLDKVTAVDKVRKAGYGWWCSGVGADGMELVMDLLVFAAALLVLLVLVGGHLVFAAVTATHALPGGSPWWAELEEAPANPDDKE